MDYLTRLRQSRRPTFRQHVTLLLGSSIFLLTVVLTILVEVAARRQLTYEVGIVLHEAAFQAVAELERITLEHQQMLALMGEIGADERVAPLVEERLRFIATVEVVAQSQAPVSVMDGQVQVAAPLNNQSLVGILDSAMLQEVLLRLLEPLSPQTELFVYTRDGQPLLSAGTPAPLLSTEAVEQLRQNQTQAVDWSDSDSFLMRSAFSAELDLLVVVRQQAQHALTPTRQLQRQIWGIGAAVGILFLLISWSMVERITKPLASMAASARFISEGNHDHTIPLYENTLETELLSTALRELIAVSRQLQHDLKQKVVDRSQTLAVLYELLALATRSQDVAAWFAATVAQLRTATGATDGAVFDADGVRQVGEGAFDEAQLAMVLRDGEGVVSAETIYTPLKAAGVPVAVLALRRTEPFSADHRTLITAVADQFGLMLNSLRLQAENERLLIVDERHRLARELHDAVTQSLYSLTLLCNALRHQQQLGNHAVVDEIASEIEHSAHAALREMRLLLHNLRPSDVSTLGLAGALRQRLAAVEKRAGIQVTTHIDDALHLSAPLEDALYFIAVESLNNALRHAQSERIIVTLQNMDGAVTMMIQDFGHGFDTAEASDGFGLRNMQERVAQIGGSLQIDSQPQHGTTVTVRISER